MSYPVQPPADAIRIEGSGHTTYHLVTRDYWFEQSAGLSYLPEQFESDGFVHCTDTIEEVIAVGNRYYREDSRPYLLLEIDCGAVAAPIVYEDPGQIFPHIYGPVDRAAVRRVRSVLRDEDGDFLSIEM